MKKLFFVSFILFNSAFAADHQPGHPDILIQSRLDHNWTEFVVSKVRKYFETKEKQDPLDRVVGDIHYEDFLFKKSEEKSKLQTQVFAEGVRKELAQTKDPSGESNNMFDRLLKSKHINEAKIKVDVFGLAYNIQRFSFDAKPGKNPNSKDINVDFQVRAGNILVKADKIEISITLPVQGVQKEFIKFVMTKPWIKTPSAKMVENTSCTKNDLPKTCEGKKMELTDLYFSFILKVLDKNDHFEFDLLNTSFANLNKYIDENGALIKLSPHLSIEPDPFPLLRLGDQIWILTESEKAIQEKISKKEFNVNNFLMDKDNFGMSKFEVKTANVRYVDFGAYFERHQNELKLMLLREVISNLQESTGAQIGDEIKKLTLAKESWINGGPITTKLKVDELTTNESSHVVTKMSAGLCMTESFDEKGIGCLNYTKPARTLTQAQLKESMDNITKSIDTNESDLVVSISESFLSHALKTTYLAGLWDRSLAEQTLYLNTDINPNFMLMLMDKKGQTGSLFMDATYYGLESYERFALNKKKMRLGLNYDVLIEVTKKNEIPMIIIDLLNADMSDEWIKFGAPQYGIDSEIQHIKFLQKQVIASSREEIRRGIGIKIEIPLADLLELGVNEVEYVNFESDGLGRANIKLKIKDSKNLKFFKPRSQVYEELKNTEANKKTEGVIKRKSSR